jgi:mannose-6-phosphate isomerase-like protein (cupin superfamily)
MNKVNIIQKFEFVKEFWKPAIIGEVNESYIKIVKSKGEFVWHHHDNEDEMFLIIKGTLIMRLRDRDEIINEGEFIIIPKGVEHKPVAEEDVYIMLIEPKTTLNTGNIKNERTVEHLKRL